MMFLSLLSSSAGGSSSASYLQIALLAAAGIAMTTVASAYTYHFYQQKQRRGEAPVKRSWIPYLGMALEMGAKPIKLFQSLKEEYGDIFGLITLGNRMFIISDPHSYHLILNASPKELSVDEFFEGIESNFFGVVNHTFEHSIAKTGYSKHLFMDSGLMALTERMQLHMQDIIREIRPGRYQMNTFLSKLIFDASIAALVNKEAGSNSAFYKAFVEFDKALPVAAAGIDIKRLSGAATARSVLIDACRKYRDNNSQFMESRWEVLNKLMSEGKLTADDAVRYQVAMMWASVGNTMPATFWLIYFLLSNQDILGRVKEEIKLVCGPDSTTEVIPMSKLNRLVLLNACITETLRLTSGSLIMRIAQKPLTLTLSSGETYSFRKGDRVGLCPPLTHLDNDVYANANTFFPDRWLVGSTEEELMESSMGKISLSKNGKALAAGVGYLPFGGGATLCPGRKFARNEVKTLAVYLLNSFSMSLDDTQQTPEFDGARCGLGIFPPKDDISIIVN
jgi:cytochrome P450